MELNNGSKTFYQISFSFVNLATPIIYILIPSFDRRCALLVGSSN